MAALAASRLLSPAEAQTANAGATGAAPAATVASATAAASPGGPCEIHDEQVLAQPRLTLPALTPRTTPARAWTARLSVLWSNSFAWTQDAPGETPEERSFLVDGETLTADLTVRRGLAADVDVGLRLPLRWRGGGTLDSVIDVWHRLLKLPDGNRPDFRRNAFRVEGLTRAGRPFSWSDRPGSGLGNLELETRWRFADGGRDGLSAALVARAALPTGTGPFDANGFGAGGQMVLAAPLGRSTDLYAGVGFTAQASGPVRGIRYQPRRIHAFFALERRVGRRLSLVAETNAASRLVNDIDRYPGTHWMLDFTARLDLGRRTRLDLGFAENLKDQQSTTDLALYVAVGLRP